MSRPIRTRFDPREAARRVSSWTTIAIAAGLIGWWLFGELYTRHFGSRDDDSTIRFAHFGTYEDYQLWQGVIRAFEQANPGVEVRQEYIPGLSHQYNTKMRQQAITATLPDVAQIQLAPFHQLAGHFAVLDDWVREARGGEPALVDVLDPAALDAFRTESGLRGVPLAGGNLLIYLNLDCVERAARHLDRPVQTPGQDWTMAEFRSLARDLTLDLDADGTLDQFGFWLPRWVYYQPFLWSFGADVVDVERHQWLLQGPAAERAIGFYKDLTIGDRVCPKPAEIAQLFQDTGFLTGKVAMCINGPWFQPFLDRTTIADRYVVLHIPRGPAGRVTRITWDALVIRGDASAQRRDMARSFVRFVLSRAVQDRIAGMGRAIPARTESVEAFLRSARPRQRAPFIEALGYSRLQPYTDDFARIDRVINTHMARLLATTPPPNITDFLAQLADDPAIAMYSSAAGSTVP